MFDRVKTLNLAVAALILFSPASFASSARGQDIGIFRAPQGRRVGGVRLPTPPFNPDAGILDSRRRRAPDSHKTAVRHSSRHNVKRAANRNSRPGTPRGRRVRRGRNRRYNRTGEWAAS